MAPPKSELPEGLEASQFEQQLNLVALRVSCRDCSSVLKDPKLASVVIRHRGMRNVAEDPADAGQRLVLLVESVKEESLQETMPPEAYSRLQELLAVGKVSLAKHQVTLGYEHLSAEAALARLLPPGMEVPTSFETIGQIAHFNLRPVHEPFKHLIGRIVLEKNRSLRTVVNKVGELSNEFRTFDMEVLAGQANFHTIVRECGLSFELDYSEVYWNSRLGQERQRVLKQLTSGEVVIDMMAGIGAMSCFAATAGCMVFSNDLNARGAHWMEVNVKRNRLEGQMRVFNMDAREFVRHVARTNGLFQSSRKRKLHVIMNLPELALDFLDVFRGLCEGGEEPGPTLIHCYCFARQEPPEAEVLPRVEAALGQRPPGLTCFNVRDVAPTKIMYCVEFAVPKEVLLEHPSKRRRVSTEELEKDPAQGREAAAD